jgi:hypothetical protein
MQSAIRIVLKIRKLESQPKERMKGILNGCGKPGLRLAVPLAKPAAIILGQS